MKKKNMTNSKKEKNSNPPYNYFHLQKLFCAYPKMNYTQFRLNDRPRYHVNILGLIEKQEC